MKKILLVFGFWSLVFGLCYAEQAGLLWPSTLEGKFAFPALFEDGENGAVLVSGVIGSYDNSTRTISSRLQARRISPNGFMRWTTNLTTHESSLTIRREEDIKQLASSRMAARLHGGKYWSFGYPGVTPYLPGNAGGVLFKKPFISSAMGVLFFVTDGEGGFYGIGQESDGTVIADRITKDGERHPSWSSSVTIANKPGQEASLLKDLRQWPATICQSSDGGVIMVWMQSATTEYRTGNSAVVYIQKLNSAGVPQWNNGQPLRLSSWIPSDPYATREAYARAPVVASDGAGGAVAFWHQNPVEESDKDVWAARVKSDGTFKWGPKNITSDDWGKYPILIVTNNFVYASWNKCWVDQNSGHVIRQEVYLQKFRVDDGSPAYGWSKPIIVDRVDGDEKYYHIYLGESGIFPDGQGGVILTYGVAALPKTKAIARRIDSSGKKVWEKTIAYGDYAFPMVIWKNSNEFIVGVSSSEASGRDVAVIVKQKISDGSEVWRKAIDPGGYNYWVGGVEDGAGGIIASWWNTDNPPPTDVDIPFIKNVYVQRLNGSGEVIWKNVTAVTFEAGRNDNSVLFFGLVPAGTGSAIGPVVNVTSSVPATYNRVGDIALYRSTLQAQKLDAETGEKKWWPEGVTFYQNVVQTQEAVSIAAAADDAGGTAFVWIDNNNVYACWLDENAALVTGITTLESSPERASHPRVLFTGGGSMLAMWDRNQGTGETQRIVARRFNKDGTLGSLVLVGTGMATPELGTRAALSLGDKVITVVDDKDTNRTMAVLLNRDGVKIGSVNAPAGHRAGQIAISEDNNLLFSYWKTGSAIGPIYISKIPVSSISGTVNVATVDAWMVISAEAPQTASFLHSLSSDGSGGAVVTFVDFRKLTSDELNRLEKFLGEGPWPLTAPEFASYDGEIYAQRIDSKGNRMWGDAGILVGSGNYLQAFPEGVKSVPGGSMLFSYLDTSSSRDKGALGWLAEAVTKIQKVGPVPLAKFAGISIDGRMATGLKEQVSTKPILTVGVEDPNNVRHIKIYVNDKEFTTITVIKSVNDIALNLPDAGDYVIKVVLTDIQGMENTETFTVASPGAEAAGLIIGSMAVSPSPVTAETVKISYVLANDTATRLFIFDPTGGRPVLSQTYSAGSMGGMASYNEVSVEVTSLGNGIYPLKLYRVSDGFELGKSYMVIKR